MIQSKCDIHLLLIIERFPDYYRQPKLIAINTNNVMKQPDPEMKFVSCSGWQARELRHWRLARKNAGNQIIGCLAPLLVDGKRTSLKKHYSADWRRLRGFSKKCRQSLQYLEIVAEMQTKGQLKLGRLYYYYVKLLLMQVRPER